MNCELIDYLYSYLLVLFFTDLIRQGIDPEAYCFLCKKEFGGKAFLKAHKQTVHSGKGDKGQSQRVTPMGTITPPTSVSPVSVTSPAHSQQQQQQHIGTNSDTFQWRWKEGNQVGFYSRIFYIAGVWYVCTRFSFFKEPLK